MSNETTKETTLQMPTCGRTVHYFANSLSDPLPFNVVTAGDDTNSSISGTVNDHRPTSVTGCEKVQDIPHKSKVADPATQPYWDWMDYQKGQQAANSFTNSLVKVPTAKEIAAELHNNDFLTELANGLLPAVLRKIKANAANKTGNIDKPAASAKKVAKKQQTEKGATA